MAGAKVGPVELVLYRPFSSLYHSYLASQRAGRAIRELGSGVGKFVRAHRFGLWEEATLEIENSAFRYLEN